MPITNQQIIDAGRLVEQADNAVASALAAVNNTRTAIQNQHVILADRTASLESARGVLKDAQVALFGLLKG